jgi:hypothetical protein
VKFIVVDKPERHSFLVYCELRQLENGARIFQSNIGPPSVHEVFPDQEPPTFMEPISYELANALGEALAPRPVATERHLDDAITTRDRLLSMLERQNARVP